MKALGVDGIFTSSTPTGRERVCSRRMHATRRFPVAERLAGERQALRPLPRQRFDYAYRGSSRVPLGGYLRFAGSFYPAPEALIHQRVELHACRDEGWISHRGAQLARYPRSHRLERLAQTAERARAKEWPYEQFLLALLEAQALARDASLAPANASATGSSRRH